MSELADEVSERRLIGGLVRASPGQQVRRGWTLDTRVTSHSSGDAENDHAEMVNIHLLSCGSLWLNRANVPRNPKFFFCVT